MSSLLQPKTPTDEQLAVLESISRITVVRACPGAGKTEVFVEAIRRRLQKWESYGNGLAALSFTNIARDTIETRVGGAIASPHFVGTLDSFIFRFIVRPFGHLVGLPTGTVRLFPAVVCDHLDSPSIQVGLNTGIRASLFDVHFCGLAGEKPALRADAAVSGSFTQSIAVPTEMIDTVWEEKKKFWKNTGIVTHSDCHFLASSVLRHKDHGAPVRALIARRFPVLFIDELQDTGFFLARAFLALFREPAISGLVVGDPNQAIYGFGGASPTIFDDFEKLDGAKPFTLKLSQRCPKSVARVATALSFTGVVVESLPEAPEGMVTLVVHALDEPRFNPSQAKFIRELSGGKQLAVIARKRITARAIKGDVIRDEFKGKSKAARKINLALQHLLNGEPREAAQIVERELCRVVFDDERASAEMLEKNKISREQWRAAIFHVLTSTLTKVEGETWNQWVERVKVAIETVAVSVGWKKDKKSLLSYKKCQEHGETLRNVLLDVPVTPLWQSNDTVTTIHKVKGAEFDTVVLFVPKPTKQQCPSVQWWNDGEGEERRIAFVAASRAKQRLVLCMHTQTMDALKQSRSDFVAIFQETHVLPGGT